jgi:lysophospholipase L1-like esterase
MHAFRPFLHAALGLLLALTLAASPARAGDDPEVWVAFGDSLTASQKWPWTSILERETGIRIINSGRNRGTTTQALEHLEADVLAHRPDLVLIMFGMNDQRIPNRGRPGVHAVSPERYAANLDTMITRIQAIGARVVLLTNRPVIQGPAAPRMRLYLDRTADHGRLYTTPGKANDSIQQYNDIVRAKAKEHGTFLVDIWQAVVEKAGGTADADLWKVGLERPPPLLDGVHLGPGGARFYADTIKAAMPFR